MSNNEIVEIEPYDDEWPEHFKKEAQALMSVLPEEQLLEFHHIGSTAIPEMPAKPIIDIGVMINSFDEAKEKIVPVMQEKGYEYCWRTDRQPPFMTFIKTDSSGKRTHHVHMAEEEHNFWDRLYFREYL
ncbi:MAG: GrpB family protein, partial [Halobacteriovoraceae bacterium]|nr:GrpB family protein [Halobacteriovoraceae bacterium]